MIAPIIPNIGKIELIITTLEMKKPAIHGPVMMPFNIKIHLLRAEKPTLSFYRYMYNTIGERSLWWERREMLDAALLEIIQDPKVEIYVIYADGVPAGMIELDCRNETEIDIPYFGMIEEHVGRGLGVYLVDWATRRAWQHEPTKITTKVTNLDMRYTVRFFQKAGFEPVRQEKTWIDDPKSKIMFQDQKHIMNVTYQPFEAEGQ